MCVHIKNHHIYKLQFEMAKNIQERESEGGGGRVREGEGEGGREREGERGGGREGGRGEA